MDDEIHDGDQFDWKGVADWKLVLSFCYQPDTMSTRATPRAGGYLISVAIHRRLGDPIIAVHRGTVKHG